MIVRQAVAAPEVGAEFELLLSIGGVVGHVVLEGPTAAFVAAIESRFAAFSLPNSPQVNRTFTLRLRCEDAVAKSDPTRDGDTPALRIDVSGNNVTVERVDFAAVIGRPLPSAGPSEGRGRTWNTVWAFESLLRILWSVYLPRAGGALLHACGLHNGGRGIVAPAGSGVGKSTLARKAGSDAMTDEIVAVHRGGDQRWRLSATPFHGERSHGQPSLRSHQLAGIAFLEQQPALDVKPLSLTEGVARALACLICFESGSAAVDRNLTIVIELCRQVPVMVCASAETTPWSAILAGLTPHLTALPPGAAPDTIRELVSALRSNLRLHGRYAFAPRGGSMSPFVRSGDTVFVETVTEAAVRTGDVLLYWRAGATADADTLTCHRMIGRLRGDDGSVILTKGDSLTHIEAFQTGSGGRSAGGRAELIGRVRAISRAGHAHSWAVPGRIGSLGIVMASLLTAGLFPLTRLVPRK